MFIIPKGLTHDFRRKFESSSESQFLWKIFIHDVYLYSNWQKRLSRLLKCQSNIVWKCPFFVRGYPLIFVKNRTFLLSLISFGIDLHMMFKCILNEKKKHFLYYKNVILTYWETGKMSIFPFFVKKRSK